VRCTFSKELLALHVEGDLPAVQAELASKHLAACQECGRFSEQLRQRLMHLKSLSRTVARSEDCAGVRREVMSAIRGRRQRWGWGLGIERALLAGFRKHAYVFAAYAIVAAVSASAFTQFRSDPSRAAEPSAVFDGRDTLRRPEGYREWILVSRSGEPHHSTAGASRSSVYISPAAYREFTGSGRFPEGTVMVLESVDGSSRDSLALIASVKDSSRFEGGWGFFDFSREEGRPAAKAQELPESSGCRSCHDQRAETDHVFTQFYPALTSALPKRNRTAGSA
jgi:hypothetical protein